MKRGWFAPKLHHRPATRTGALLGEDAHRNDVLETIPVRLVHKPTWRRERPVAFRSFGWTGRLPRLRCLTLAPWRTLCAAACVAVTLVMPAPAVAAGAGVASSPGSVWAWGSNNRGQLGNGTNTDSASPAPASLAPGIVAVAAGGNFSLALKFDGSVWAWGFNLNGQLGNGCTIDNNCNDSATRVQVSGLSDIAAIAAAGYHSLALRADGTVWAWGSGRHGELGNGCLEPNCNDSSIPVQVVGPGGTGTLSGVVAIAGGGDHSLALRADGTVWAWGSDGYGQLGTGCTVGTNCTDDSIPVQVSNLSGVVAIAGGQNGSLALRSDGTVWAWGYDGSGALGDGCTIGTNCTGSSTPVQVVGPGGTGTLSGVVAVAAGYAHSLAVRSDGTVWAWGYNGDGELGDGTTTSSSRPVQVTAVGNGGAAIALGPVARHSLLISQAYPSISPSSLAFSPASVGSISGSQPVTVTNTGLVPLSVSGASLVGQDADEFKLSGDSCTGTVVAIGASCTIGIRFSPLASGPVSAQLRIASSGPGGYSLVLLSGAALPGPTSGLSFSTRAGPAFATGANNSGQLGNGGPSVSSPVLVKPARSFVALAGGDSHSLGLRADGTVWAWGADSAGQLGNGSTVDSHAPVQVPAPAGMVAIAAGQDHSLALRADGTVWAWGDNSNGQLGDGTASESLVPVGVSGLSNVVAIAGGVAHSLALRSDGTVWAWGSDAAGQLGDGCTIGTSCNDSSTPMQVSGLSGVVAIAAGAAHNLALRSDGTVWAWGDDEHGQLGDGCTIGTNCNNSSTPMQVAGLSNVVAIATGGLHSLALRSDGTVWAWGNNAFGQLGDGTTTDSSTPVQVLGAGATGTLTGVVAISGGFWHSLALRSDGTVWAWGDNAAGQLGNGSTTDSSTPVQMSSLGHGGAALGSGSEGAHSLVIGQPYASLSASTLNFGSQPVGSPSSSQTETVTNSGAVPLQISQDKITGADGDEFTITGDGCAGTTVAPGASCTIGLRFDPKVSGASVATLRILSNSPTSPDLVTLDPPALITSFAATNGPTATPKPTAHPAIASCSRVKATRGVLILHCRLAAAFRHRRSRLKLRLSLGSHTIAIATVRTHARRQIVFHMALPRGLKAGSYTLTIATTTNNPNAQTAQTITLPRLRNTART